MLNSLSVSPADSCMHACKITRQLQLLEEAGAEMFVPDRG